MILPPKSLQLTYVFRFLFLSLTDYSLGLMVLTPPPFLAPPPPPSLAGRREGIRVSRRESSITPLDEVIFGAYPPVRSLAQPRRRRFRLETPVEEGAHIASGYDSNDDNNLPFEDSGLRIQDHDDPIFGEPEPLFIPTVTPASKPISPALPPAVESVTPVLAPVLEPAIEPVAPAVEPIAPVSAPRVRFLPVPGV